MISILIPVFNRDITALTGSLHRQLMTAEVKTEILVMDDASTDKNLKNINRSFLSGLAHVQYIELSSNSGRNIIRHQLANAAQYETLIFLDADSSFPDDLWLQRYIQSIKTNTIIMGGRKYKDQGPGQSTLHFHYGQAREQAPAAMRNKFPYRSFLACNFSISRQQLAQLIVDRNLHGYCHEDTFMGLQFAKLGIPVLHIDNPVYHEGIDDDTVFIRKQREALENLQYLYNNYGSSHDFANGVKLIRVYKKLTGTAGGKYILAMISRRKNYCLTKALQSHRLFWLDCWKLAEFHQLYTGKG